MRNEYVCHMYGNFSTVNMDTRTASYIILKLYENWKLKMGDKNTNMTKLVIILFLWEGNKSTKNLSSIGQTKIRKLLWELLL